MFLLFLVIKMSISENGSANKNKLEMKNQANSDDTRHQKGQKILVT